MRKIAVVGLGYVGLPVAVEFGKKQPVIGFDINEARIKDLQKGIDFTNEVEQADLNQADMTFTSDPTKLSEADFIIVAVPTPITETKQPDLTPLLKASETVGKHMSKDTIVVFESTVYPGATEEDCVPVLEKHSGLVNGKDFFVGYSPERINPGDKVNTFKTITKVVSGQTDEVLNIIADVYASVVDAGVFKAKSIKVAEAAKVIENTQRDINIALMNELAIIFEKMDIDTSDVLEAAGTKWNFLNFSPGLVGGHCIGVDPYYLTYKAEQLGHYPEMILAGRQINDFTGKFIARKVVKDMIREGINMQSATITILGFTFKENVPDIRNTRVIDMIEELESFGLTVQVTDAYADAEEVKRHYDIDLVDQKDLKKTDAVIYAVPHESYQDIGWQLFDDLYNSNDLLVFDVKGELERENKPSNVILRRL
ncbi:MAG TPA: nucleotide sugar dehydrogenase [Pseudogracilibacillus sp.]|nr:nucleotide sugar dehydrogenase [Pseudogracilibacillus sp.]